MIKENNFCPFIQSECRNDCVFFEAPINNCFIYWCLESYCCDMETVKALLSFIKQNTEN